MSELADALNRVTRFTQRLEGAERGREYLNGSTKWRLDRFGGHVLSLLGGPIVSVANMAASREDGGPGIIQLPRVGRDGATFGEYKVRSMSVGSERDPLELGIKPRIDSRITRVGRFIRALSIDELPQARNILDGDMSLVGSRPKTWEQVQAYDAMDDDFYEAYTSMRPGLTGLEQIKGRGAVTAEQRIELTKEYAAEASLKLDQDIIKKTIAVVALRHGAY